MSENTMRCSVIIAAIMLAGAFAAPTAFAQQEAGTWSMAAPLPVARSEMKAATVDGMIYLIGGAWDEVTEPERVTNHTTGFTTEYDPLTDRWRERARSPEGLTHQAVAVLDGKIYVVGGFASSQHTLSSAGVYSYDPATDHWQTLAPLSGPQGGGVLAAVDGMLHAIGGRVMGDETFGTHSVYNPATNSWHSAAPLPTARDHAGVFVVDGKIHLIGGRLGPNPSNIDLHDIYDPATDSWTSAAPMPTPRSSSAFVEYRGMLFYAGGECRDRTTYDEVEAYDTSGDRWLTFPALPVPRHAFTAAVAADKLFFFGGSTRCGGGGKLTDTLVLTLP